jgi:large subunit ribosomal protein L10
MPTAEKIKVVEDMTQEFRKAGSVFVADYAGLRVGDMTELRKQLRGAGVSFRVVKNTLLRRAAGDAGLGELSPEFKGPTAVAFGPADPVATAKIFHEFYSRLEKPTIRRFVFDKRTYANADLKAIASLPPREVILSQLLASIEGPIAGFVGTLDAMIRELVGTVDAIAEKKQ